MAKWKQKFEQSNRTLVEDMKRIRRSYHYNFFDASPSCDSAYRTYSRFSTLDSVLAKGNIADVRVGATGVV